MLVSRMKTLMILLGLLILFNSPFAHSIGGIGRVGTSSIGSEEMGFITPLPNRFPLTQTLPSRVLITSPFIRNANGQEQILVETVVSVFGDESTEYTRKDWETLAEANSGEVFYVQNPDECVLGMRWVNSEGQFYGIAVWGQGKGVLFSSIGTTASWNAIRNMIKNIELTDGACAWN